MFCFILLRWEKSSKGKCTTIFPARTETICHRVLCVLNTVSIPQPKLLIFVNAIKGMRSIKDIRRMRDCQSCYKDWETWGGLADSMTKLLNCEMSNRKMSNAIY